jgi:hypothetical protein
VTRRSNGKKPKVTFELESENGEIFDVSFSLRGILSTVMMAHGWAPLKDELEKQTADQRLVNELSERVQVAFPVEPMPRRYWIDAIEPLDDIPKELANRIAYRPWIDVTMLAWTMTGAHAATARNYFEPDAFRYYLPSLLVGGLNDFRYIDWPLECLLPAGRKRRTTGEWWQAFFAGFSVEQKDAIGHYLIGVQGMLDGSVHLGESHLIDEAQVIWGS